MKKHILTLVATLMLLISYQSFSTECWRFTINSIERDVNDNVTIAFQFCYVYSDGTYDGDYERISKMSGRDLYKMYFYALLEGKEWVDYSWYSDNIFSKKKGVDNYGIIDTICSTYNHYNENYYLHDTISLKDPTKDIIYYSILKIQGQYNPDGTWNKNRIGVFMDGSSTIENSSVQRPRNEIPLMQPNVVIDELFHPKILLGYYDYNGNKFPDEPQTGFYLEVYQQNNTIVTVKKFK